MARPVRGACRLGLQGWVGLWLAALVPAGVAGAEKLPVAAEPTIPVEYAVLLAADANANAIAAAAGMEMIARSRVRPAWYFFRPSGEMPRDQAVAALESAAGVLRAAGGPNVARAPAVFVPDDPYFFAQGGEPNNPGQWHLANPYTPGLDIGVRGAWSRGLTGLGQVIGIVDDSTEPNHPDLRANFSAALSWDFGQNDADPSPVHDEDGHGVSTSGLAAARGGNGLGVTGVAPQAALAGLRVDFVDQQLVQFFDAALHRNDVIRVKSHSYGVITPYVRDDVTVLVNRIAAAEGVVNVRSAGNSRMNANSISALADRTSIVVSAVASDGTHALYSNFGANVFVTVPSSGEATDLGITTTDATGARGLNTGAETDLADANYTRNFGGTSVSAPLVAGVVAQMRQVNPNLDVRAVKHVLARTSRRVDADNEAWQRNGAGLWFNPNYGFGLVDADAATRLAGRLVSVTPETSYDTGEIELNLELPDDDPNGVAVLFDMAGSLPLETVELHLRFTHTFAGDLAAALRSPAGTISQVAYDHTLSDADNLAWTFSTAAFWGESVTGTWAVWVADNWAKDTGTWDAFSMTAYAGAAEFLPSEIDAVTATALRTSFDPNAGDAKQGELVASGSADVVVQHRDGQSTFEEAFLRLTALLESDHSGEQGTGLASGVFGDGAISLTDAIGDELLAGELLELVLNELPGGGGILAGDGRFRVTGGRLTDVFGGYGEVVQITFQVDPAGLGDFSQAFEGVTNLTLTPEPATLGLLAAGLGMLLWRRRRR
jgi:subtilisin family serine protease